MVDITEISAMVAAGGVLVGVVYYVLDMRNQAKLRQTDMVMRLYDKFGSPEFQKWLQYAVNLNTEDFADYVRKHEEATPMFYSMGAFFEGVGVLVKRKLISMDLVDDLFSTAIKQCWERMASVTKEARIRRKSSAIGEWFEYLYNELKKREQKLQSKA
nr:hypothetical protein [Candidatus Njordarchaeum guaymaensis]